MTTGTFCDDCGRPITGKPLFHVVSTTTPPAHPPADFDTVSCYTTWDLKQKAQENGL